MTLLLGSQSPRRAEILAYFSIPFRQVASDFDEESIAYNGDATQLARQLALSKAKVLAQIYPQETILTADTVVAIDGLSLGKPSSPEEAKEMLTRLCGRWHSVITAVTSYNDGQFFCEDEETRVLCNVLTPEEIHRYMCVHKLEDKAGGYAIQQSGSILIRRIDGCYYNVLGLPINGMRRVLKQADIDLWDYLKNF